MMADDFPLTVFLVIHVRVTSLHLSRFAPLNDIEGVDALIYGRVVAEASDMDFVQGALRLQFKELMEIIDNGGVIRAHLVGNRRQQYAVLGVKVGNSAIPSFFPITFQ